MLVPINTDSLKAQNNWDHLSPKSTRDLFFKKIVIVAIGTLNLAALAGTVYYTAAYCPIPTQALFVSPVIIGALGTLAYLKYPTGGISSKDYQHYSNPALLLGKAVTYAFFAPLMYVVDSWDWNNYHDIETVREIADDLENKRFEEIAETHGRHFSNFVKYGIIHSDYKVDLFALYTRYKVNQKDLKRLERFRATTTERAGAETEKGEIHTAWTNLKGRMTLVRPDIPEAGWLF